MQKQPGFIVGSKIRGLRNGRHIWGNCLCLGQKKHSLMIFWGLFRGRISTALLDNSFYQIVILQTTRPARMPPKASQEPRTGLGVGWAAMLMQRPDRFTFESNGRSGVGGEGVGHAPAWTPPVPNPLAVNRTRIQARLALKYT